MRHRYAAAFREGVANFMEFRGSHLVPRVHPRVACRTHTVGRSGESGVLSHPTTTVRLVQMPITRSARRQAHETSGVHRKLVTTHETRPRRAAFRLQCVDPWRPLPEATSDSCPAGRARAKRPLAATGSAPPVGARGGTPLWRGSPRDALARAAREQGPPTVLRVLLIHLLRCHQYQQPYHYYVPIELI